MGLVCWRDCMHGLIRYGMASWVYWVGRAWRHLSRIEMHHKLDKANRLDYFDVTAGA